MQSGQNLDNLKKYIRATNYLTVAQIFLQNNFLLENELKPSDIKPRLLGHWGSCPGANHIYAHLLNLARQNQDRSPLKTAFMLGPGHAFPALQANLFLENTLAQYDENATRDKQGIEYISRLFSWPGGFPSHASPFTPGVILEGGELGYSLSTAFGAVLDNPNLVMATLIGDGEAETGAIASAWHLNKLIDPVKNGVVLPILHLNKYKISGPTIYGAMSDFELIQYFHGAGWEPKIVDEYATNDFDESLNSALKDIYLQIEKIKNGRINRSGENGNFVRLPMLIVRNKKGSSGPDTVDGEKIEGNSSAHQVPLSLAASDAGQLHQLENWLKSYQFDELFDAQTGKFGAWLDEFLPENENLIGQNEFINPDNFYKPLSLPINQEEIIEKKGKKSLAMNAVGEYLAEIFRLNPDNFRFFSPDETYSNKLNAIFEQTSRSWQRKIELWEKDLAADGRVSEILNENSLQGLLQGYLLTGRHGALTSYEAFAPIMSSMMDQYAKFLTQSLEVQWRKPLASLNYILTSTGWRQDHNGFSHQNPSFIDEVLRRQNKLGQVFLPIDDTAAVVASEEIFASADKINVLVAGKTPEPRFLDLASSKKQMTDSGVFVRDFYSDSSQLPDVILACAGDYVSKEMVAAVQVLKHDAPALKIRFVNISVLGSGETGAHIGSSENPLSDSDFSELFPSNTKVIFNFHGYPQTIRAILAEYSNYRAKNYDIGGYIEKGSTTTPFDMLARNKVSRYDVAKKVAEQFNKEDLIREYQTRLDKNKVYARETGVDLPEIDNWDFIKLV
ncbi:MAG: phosphoketolase family protein [Candidatus Sacchiramonaceae bacterium]|nr:phosphoketolase family protein [Candidatus Saccharimonadaceae bacterium]